MYKIYIYIRTIYSLELPGCFQTLVLLNITFWWYILYIYMVHILYTSNSRFFFSGRGEVRDCFNIGYRNVTHTLLTKKFNYIPKCIDSLCDFRDLSILILWLCHRNFYLHPRSDIIYTLIEVIRSLILPLFMDIFW